MFCNNKQSDPAERRSREIERELEYDAKIQSEYKKLLLLGTGEVGKTTIIKQMKIIHINGFTEDERKEKVPFIKQNIHESIYQIVKHMDLLSPPVLLADETNNRSSVEFIMKIGPKEPDNFTNEYFDHVKGLWADSGVKECFNRSNEYQLIDSAEHFLNQIDVIRESSYVPNTQDILFCRIMTTSISKIQFEMNVSKKYGGGVAKFWMYDVGGQRGHQKKWISVFEGIHAVLFLIAASDFDQTLREDEKKNRLKESLEIFENIYWGRYLRQAGMIVFLNKQDILQRKIENGKRIDKYFPDYKTYKPTAKEGNPGSEYEKAKFFMRQKLIDITKKKPDPELLYVAGFTMEQEIEDRDIYVHFTVATDTNNIKKVFDSIHDIILKQNLSSAVF